MCTRYQEVYDTRKHLLVVAFLLISVAATITAVDLRYDYFLHEHPGIRQFFNLIQTSPLLRSVILWKQGSLFVPTNEAIDEFYAQNRIITNTTLLYHFCNFQMRYTELKQDRSISTETTGNIPIWITTKNTDLYLNDAKYMVGDFRVFMQIEDSQSAAATIVHIIDRVLDPTVPGISESQYLHNPDAGKFLDHASAYDVTDHQLVTVFREQVSKNQKMELFKQAGIQTYFVPVDAAFREHKINKNGIDAKVIYGHIIPKKAIFLRALEPGEEFETYKQVITGSLTQYTNQAEVKGQPTEKPFTTVITFENSTVDGRKIWLVNSDNRQGDETHRKGVVQAEIIRGNIPVKNGVVHLISKPLVIIDMNVLQTFEWYGTKQHVKPMWKFLELFRKLLTRGDGDDIRQILQGHGSPKGVTLYVPSNEAMEKSYELQHRLKNNLTAISELIRTHIVQETVSADDMIEHSKMRRVPFQVQTTFPGRKLLFSHVLKEKDGERTIHLEGGGVNASVVQADFGATNGYIHIIDGVLGIPDQTVQEKLRIHPMLQGTYHLWKKSKMDELLTQSGTLTLFAPSDKAWVNIRRISDEAYQNIFQGSTQDLMVQDILKRHLIPNQVYSIEDLAEMSLVMGNRTVSKGMKGNWTVSRYPIETAGSRGYLKVNQSAVLLTRGEQQIMTTPLPPRERTRTGMERAEESHYYIYWDRTWAHVIRTNVRCTNGIIHIIDDVLMDNEEVTVAGAEINIPFRLISLSLLRFLAAIF